MLIRNDDVAADTTLKEITTLCEMCDRYGVGLIHAITPIGNVQTVHCDMDNATIRKVTGTTLFSENRPVVDYLLARKDQIATHGLWHTHRPRIGEIEAADVLIGGAGFESMWYVPPFNENPSADEISTGDWEGIRVLGAGIPRLEEFLKGGAPKGEVTYLHSWRFEVGGFSWARLDACLKRLTQR